MAVTVHRCRGRLGSAWLFEGDDVGRADRPVPAGRLIGPVVAVEHAGRVRRLGRADRLLGTATLWARRARRLGRGWRARARG